MATFYDLNIKEITQETADAVSVVFTIPENLTDKFHFFLRDNTLRSKKKLTTG